MYLRFKHNIYKYYKSSYPSLSFNINKIFFQRRKTKMIIVAEFNILTPTPSNNSFVRKKQQGLYIHTFISLN